jgi:hypothetical protein
MLACGSIKGRCFLDSAGLEVREMLSKRSKDRKSEDT